MRQPSNQLADYWPRLRNRLRYGLATQEILDRLSGAGLVAYPYFVVEEPVMPRPDAEAAGRGLELRTLGVDDVPRLAPLAARSRSEPRLRELMSRATCVGAFEREELLAYCWFRRDEFKALGNVGPLCELPAGWAYLFDMYVRPEARGRNIALYLRHRMHEMLAEQGVTRCCSLSLAFNRSTRRFKAKLGAVETELRLLLRIKPWRGIDLRVRRRHEKGALRTPAFRAVHPHAHTADGRTS